MYHLATMHSVTDRQTDRLTDDLMMPIADHNRSISGATQKSWQVWKTAVASRCHILTKNKTKNTMTILTV